jgi:hypothetical protein
VPLEVLLTTDGLHVPVMPFNEVPGNGFMLAGNACPSQILNAVLKLKVGVVLGVTVTLMDT